MRDDERRIRLRPPRPLRVQPVTKAAFEPFGWIASGNVDLWGAYYFWVGMGAYSIALWREGEEPPSGAW